MSKIDISMSPYFDDFSDDKNYQKILFRPGYPVQARELNQIQSILQNQIAKFGNHVFANGAQVYPGDNSGIKYSTNTYFLLVEADSSVFLNNSDYIDTYWLHKQIAVYTDSSLTNTKITAEILDYQYEIIDTTKYVRFFLHVLSGNTSDTVKFNNNDIIYLTGNKQISAVVASFGNRKVFGKCAVANLSNGVYYINNYFVNVESQKLYLSPVDESLDWGIDNLNCVIGLHYEEQIVTADDDASLYDNAYGAPNYKAPGANRLTVNITLEHHEIGYQINHSDFISLLEITNGALIEAKTGTDYNIWEHTLARRTYDESGNYTVRPFICNTQEFYVKDGNVAAAYNDTLLKFNTLEKAKTASLQLFSSALENSPYAQTGVAFVTGDNKYMPGTAYIDGTEYNFIALANKYISINIEPGKAYVKGYEIETLAPSKINLYKALTTKLDNNKYINTKLGTYIYVTNLKHYVNPYTTVDLYKAKLSTNSPTTSQLSDLKIGTAKVIYPQYISGNTDSSGVYKLYITDIDLYDEYTVGNIHAIYASNGFYCDCIKYAFNKVTGQCDLCTTPTSQSGYMAISNSTNSADVVSYSYQNTNAITYTNVVSGTNAERAYVITPTASLKQSISNGEVNITTGMYIKVGFNSVVSDPLYVLYVETSNNPASITSSVTKTFIDYTGVTKTIQIDRTKLTKGSLVVIPESSAFSITYKNTSSSTYTASSNIITLYQNCDLYVEELNSQYTDNASDSIIYRLGNEKVKTVRTDDALVSAETASNIDISYTYKILLTTNTITSRGIATFANSTNDNFENFASQNYTVIVDGIYYKTVGSSDEPTVGNVANISIDENSNLKVRLISGSYTSMTVIATKRRNSTSELAASKERKKTYNPLIEENNYYTGGNVEIFGTNSNTALPTNIELAKSDIISVKRIIHSKTSFVLTNGRLPIIGLATGLTDVTALFNVDNGQRDYYYKKGVISTNTKLTGYLYVEYEYFGHDNNTDGYFSVNSYPISDISLGTGSKCNYETVPSYTTSSGITYDLTDCIDFRRDIDANGSSIIPYEFFMADYHYYLPRKDVLYLDSNDKSFHIKRGTPSNNPQYPVVPSSGMAIYYIDLKGRTKNRGEVTLKFIDNKRYTMRDIGKLETRIENLEYYTSLSLLELDTNALTVTDASGLDKFKQGFLVDPFTSFSASNVTSSEFNCSIDTEKGLARPAIIYKNVDLIERASLCDWSQNTTGSLDDYRKNGRFYQKTGDLYTLPYESVVMDAQPNASLVVNVNPYSVVLYTGQLTLYPSVDNRVEQPNDVTLNTIDLDYSDEVAALVKNASYSFVTSKVTGASLSTSVSASSSVTSNSDTVTSSSSKSSSTPSSITTQNTPSSSTLTELTSAGHTVVDSLLNQANSKLSSNASKADKKSALAENFKYTVNNGVATITAVKVPDTVDGQSMSNAGSWVTTSNNNVKINLNNSSALKASNSGTNQLKNTTNTTTSSTTINTLSTTTENNYSSTTTTNYTQRNNYSVSSSLNIAIEDTVNTLTNSVVKGEQRTDSITYVNDIVTGKYISPRDISFVACGLLPNAKFYAFFDGVNVSQYCRMGDLQIIDNEKTVIANSGTTPGILTSDNKGNIYGVFSIPYISATDTTPEVKFKTGSRIFILTTNENNDSTDVASSAEATYTCSTVEIGKEQTDIISRPYGVASSITQTGTSFRSVGDTSYSSASSTSSWTTTDTNSYTDTNTVTQVTGSSTTSQTNSKSEVCASDPVCETFTVPESAKNGVFITSLDVYFARKPNSANIINEKLLGETVSEIYDEQVESAVIMEIRPTTEAGEPSIYVMPFGTSSKNVDEVVTNYIDTNKKRLYVRGNYKLDSSGSVTASNIGKDSGPWIISDNTHIKPNGIDSGKVLDNISEIPDYSKYEVLKANNLPTGSESNYYIDYSDIISDTVYPADLMIPTRFTFDSPIYLAPNTTYCFSLRSASNNYEVWLASTGVASYNAVSSQDINTNNVFSNLYNKKLFAQQFSNNYGTESDLDAIKSATFDMVNVGTNVKLQGNLLDQIMLYTSSNNKMGWQSQQNQDLMFRVWKAKFDISQIGTIEYVNKALSDAYIPAYSIQTIKGSSYIRVNCPNHGLTIGSIIKFKLYKNNKPITKDSDFTSFEYPADSNNTPIYKAFNPSEPYPESTETTAMGINGARALWKSRIVSDYVFDNSGDANYGQMNTRLLRVVQVEHDSFIVDLNSYATIGTTVTWSKYYNGAAANNPYLASTSSIIKVSDFYDNNSPVYLYVSINRMFSELCVNAETSAITGSNIYWDCLTFTTNGINDSSVTPFQKFPVGVNTFTSLQPRENIIFNKPMAVFSDVDQTYNCTSTLYDEPTAYSSFMNNASKDITNKSLVVRAKLISDDANISPVIDKALFTCNLLENVLNNPKGGGLLDNENVITADTRYIDTSADKLYALSSNGVTISGTQHDEIFPIITDNSSTPKKYAIEYRITEKANVVTSQDFEENPIDDFIFTIGYSATAVTLANYASGYSSTLIPVKYTGTNGNSNSSTNLNFPACFGVSNYVKSDGTTVNYSNTQLVSNLWNLSANDKLAICDLDNNILGVFTYSSSNTLSNSSYKIYSGDDSTPNTYIVTNASPVLYLTLSSNIMYSRSDSAVSYYALSDAYCINRYTVDDVGINNSTYELGSLNTAFRIHKLKNSVISNDNNSVTLIIDEDNDANLYKNAKQFDIGKYISLRKVDNTGAEESIPAIGSTQNGSFDYTRILNITDSTYTYISTVDSSTVTRHKLYIDIDNSNGRFPLLFTLSAMNVNLHQLDRFTDERSPYNGSCLSKYVCKEMVLANSADQLNISFDGYRDSTGDFELYYRTLPAGSTNTIDTTNWTLAYFDSYPSSNGSTNETSAYTSKITDIPDFTSCQVKVVMKGGNNARPPYIKNFKMIASV